MRIPFLTIALWCASGVCLRPSIGAQVAILSLDGNGQQVFASSSRPFPSGNGRWVAFESSFLLPEDITGSQVYLRDRLTGALELISVNAMGQSVDAQAQLPGLNNATAVSYDGRFVVFLSTASDVSESVPGGTNHVWLRDRLNGTTSLISKDSDGIPADASSFEFTMAPTNGPAAHAVVAFRSTATNLDPEDTDSTANQFLHETLVGTTRLMCFDASGNKVDTCHHVVLACGGGAMAFRANQPGVAAGDNFAFYDIYTGQPFDKDGNHQFLTVDLNGVPNNLGDHDRPTISCDGRRIAFATSFSIFPDDPFGTPDVYVRDAVSGEDWRLTDQGSSASGGASFGGGIPRFSVSGGWLAVETFAEMDPLDTNQRADAYLWEFHSALPAPPILISRSATEAANLGIAGASTTVADDGSVLFTSDSTNLIPNDMNSASDVFGSSKRDVFRDGFELGDVSAWSSSIP